VGVCASPGRAHASASERTTRALWLVDMRELSGNECRERLPRDNEATTGDATFGFSQLRNIHW
jgi:hypothetical protein